jgi:hypothetical protein
MNDDRNSSLLDFLYKDYSAGIIIEPDFRYSWLKNILLEAIGTYSPGVILKAGIGSGRLLLDMAISCPYIAVIEQSEKVIGDFVLKNKKNPLLEKINIINGNFKDLPADYFCADMIVDIDNFSIIETGPFVDEVRRALQFEGKFFVAASVINSTDMDGHYDDLVRSSFPLHNDYYMEEDLITFLELNEFKLNKSFNEKFEIDLSLRSVFFKNIFGNSSIAADKFLNDNLDFFKNVYSYNNGKIIEDYYAGIFTRLKPVES